MRITRSVKPAVGMIFVLTVAVVVVVLLRRERVYRVVVGPGQAVTLTVQARLQRALEHKSYAKRPGLPVTCRLVGTGASDGVATRVIETGHRLHYMWATIRISAAPDAAPGARKRTADFTIDGEGQWPKVTVVIKVRDLTSSQE